jgi:hypothetical protein
MVDTGATGKPARGRGKRDAGESMDPLADATEPVDPTASVPNGDETDAAVAPASASRRRWAVPLVLFILVLVAAIAGWAVAYVAYRDKEDTEDQLDDQQQSDDTASNELEERIAELDNRLEELESEQQTSRADRAADDADLRSRVDACVEETQALIALSQDALAGDDVGDDALDTQAGRTLRVCEDIVDALGTPPTDDTSTPPTTTLP